MNLADIMLTEKGQVQILHVSLRESIKLNTQKQYELKFSGGKSQSSVKNFTRLVD